MFQSPFAQTPPGRQVYGAYADDTIEDRIARVVFGRIQPMKEMSVDDRSTLREIERLLDGADSGTPLNGRAWQTLRHPCGGV